MTSEEKLAVRFLAKNKLCPPVDIKAVVAAIANVEYVGFPEASNADGITLSPKSARPRVFINSRKARSRQMFTLAHELGHVVIPWHTGNVISHLDESANYPYSDYWIMEREANRFASELLMPTSWVRFLFDSASGDVEVVFHRLLAEVGVSPMAATLRLGTALPAGYVWGIFDHDGILAYTGKTPETAVALLARGEEINPDLAYRFCGKCVSFGYRSNTYYWWFFGGQKAPTQATLRTWREVLDAIFSDLGYSVESRRKLQLSIASISGYVLGKRSGADADVLYGQILSRFENRPELRRVTAHKDFREYVYCRVKEFE